MLHVAARSMSRPWKRILYPLPSGSALAPLPCRAMAWTCRCSEISISFDALRCLHASESRVSIVAWYRFRSSRACVRLTGLCVRHPSIPVSLIVAVPNSLPWPDYSAWLANNAQLRVLVGTACTVGSQQPHSLLMRSRADLNHGSRNLFVTCQRQTAP